MLLTILFRHDAYKEIDASRQVEANTYGTCYGEREGVRFTRVNACHLADVQSDLLLFLCNPSRFPIWDEKLVLA